MHNGYSDIRQLVGDREPAWYDGNGTPRYCAHHPSYCPDIYANEIVLLRIACASCRRQFDVQISYSVRDWMQDLGQGDAFPRDALAQSIRAGIIHYGDPPNAGCCPSGPTMNCDDLRVLEYWRRELAEWERDESLEIVLPDGGGDGD